MLNENVVKLLKSGMWDLATCANGEPNVVPVAFKDVTSDGKLVVGDVFLDTTLKYLAAQLAVSQRPQRRQHADNAGVPLSAEQLHAVFQRAADVLFQLSLIHGLLPRFWFSPL